MPKFSLIVSAYKVEPYLRACLDSFRNQSFVDWEAICVDDGSPDGSGKILDEFAEKDVRFKVIHQQNRGVSAARNAGLEAASGEWLWFIDGDDMIVPRALQCLAEAIEDVGDSNLHVLTFGCESISGEMRPQSEGRIISSRYYDKFQRNIGGNFFSAAWSKLFRRSSLGNLRFWDCRYNEDAAFVIEYTFRGKGWLILDAALYSYRKRPGSTTCSRLSKESMALIFKTEGWLLDKALAAQRMMPEAEMGELLKVMHYRTFYTFEEGYFKLSPAERKELLPQWLVIQRRYIDVYPMSRKMRICISLAGFFNSGLLVKPIVVGLRDLNLLAHKVKALFR